MFMPVDLAARPGGGDRPVILAVRGQIAPVGSGTRTRRVPVGSFDVEDVVDPAVGAIHDSGMKPVEGAIPRIVGKDRAA